MQTSHLACRRGEDGIRSRGSHRRLRQRACRNARRSPRRSCPLGFVGEIRELQVGALSNDATKVFRHASSRVLVVWHNRLESCQPRYAAYPPPRPPPPTGEGKVHTPPKGAPCQVNGFV